MTKLTWQRYADDQGYTWKEAAERCESLVLSAQDDWRLPTRDELVSLVDLRRANPAQNVSNFPGGSSDWFWTASAGVTPSTAWYVYFYFGYVNTDAIDVPFSVRCVRGPRLVNEGRFRVPAAGTTVEDTATGMTWQRSVSPQTFTFAEAQGACAALVLDGVGGWRVPTMQELERIVDDSRSSPAIDPVAFPDTPSAPFWTSSPWAGTAELAWYVNLDDGSAIYDQASNPGRLRCVR